MADVYLSPSVQHFNIGVGAYGGEAQRMNQIADVMGYELNRHGVTTRRNRPDMSQVEVVAHSNIENSQLYLALSSNTYDGLVRGAEVFVHRYGSAAERFARRIYDRLSKLAPTEGLGIKESDHLFGGQGFYELCHTVSPAVLLKVAFHDNTEDANFIINNLYEIGREISKGVLEQLSIPYVSDTSENTAWLIDRYNGIKY